MTQTEQIEKNIVNDKPGNHKEIRKISGGGRMPFSGRGWRRLSGMK